MKYIIKKIRNGKPIAGIVDTTFERAQEHKKTLNSKDGKVNIEFKHPKGK